MNIESIRKLLGIPDDVYTIKKDQIQELINVTQDQLKSKLKKEALYNGSIPTQLDYIVEMVVIKRYRRLGNEGMASYSQSEQAKTYIQADDFAEFQSAIDKANTEADTEHGTLFIL